MSFHRTTLYPPPQVDLKRAPIEHSLLVTPVQGEIPDLFTNTYPLWTPQLGNALFGGILIGQAVHAVSQTIPDEFAIYTMTCTFLAVTDTSKPLHYHVKRLSDRRSYLSREVKAEQNNKVLFIAICSFCSTRDRSVNNSLLQLEIPSVGKERLAILEVRPTNESALTERMVLSDFLTFFDSNSTKADVDPFSWHELPLESTSKTSPPTNSLHLWSRCRGAMSDSQSSHLAVLACMSDAWFLNSVPAMAPQTIGKHAVAFMATLNHTIWFHDPQVKLDTWLFLKKGITWAADGRCLIDQRIWSQDGALVATCVQEGALRLKNPQSMKVHGKQELKESKL